MSVNDLIKRLVFICVLELIISALIYFSIPVNKGSYVAALYDKKHLLVNLKSPRIIFVGGSNIAFGLDSELVENELDMPVINFGLHASLGLKTNFNLVEKYVGKGDIIIVVPEYSIFNDHSSLYGSDDILADFLEADPENIQYMASEKWINLPLITLNILERKINREINLLLAGSLRNVEGIQGIYTRASFNSYGDVIGHLGKTPLDPGDIPDDGVFHKNIKMDESSFELLEAFHQSIAKKGGTVLFDFPSLRMQNCENTDSESFDNLMFMLKSRTTFPVLSAPYDRCYPDRYFFDTEYHLNDAGRLMRTRQFIKSLSLILK